MERRWSRQLYIPPLTALLYIFPPPLLDKLTFELCVLVLTKTLHITRNVAHVVGLRIPLTSRAQAHCLGELQGDARTFPDVSLNNFLYCLFVLALTAMKESQLIEEVWWSGNCKNFLHWFGFSCKSNRHLVSRITFHSWMLKTWRQIKNSLHPFLLEPFPSGYFSHPVAFWWYHFQVV